MITNTKKKAKKVINYMVMTVFMATSIVFGGNGKIASCKSDIKIDNVQEIKNGEKQFKEKLLSILDNNGELPEGLTLYQLSLDMLDNIGSTDPELRDSLILNMLSSVIINNYLTDSEVKNILDSALSEKHLFYNIGTIGDDSVFNRSFSLLIVNSILYRHKKTGFLTEAEIKRVYDSVMRYLKEEKDVRGYVGTKGWAHSAAHTADTLATLATCKELKETELKDILAGVKEKININYYAYVNNEADRLVTTVIKVIERNVLTEKEIVSWIKSFEKMNITEKYPEDSNLMSNHNGFLSSLYFRFKRRPKMESFPSVIEEVINNTTPDYFK